MVRSLSWANPRAKWRQIESGMVNPKIPLGAPLMTVLKQESVISDSVLNPQEVARHAVSSGTMSTILNHISRYLGVASLVQKPLFIEVTDTDLRDVLDGKTPSALMRRLDRVRSEAGFPKDVWEPFSYVTGAPSASV